jgi:3',5'-cyclic AMP phosphodiesterase CpdA
MAQLIKIAQLADIHFGAEDADAIENAKRIISEEAPDVIAVCGDVTQRGKRVEFQQAFDFLNAFRSPVLVVPGNHDVPLLNMASRFKAPFKRYEKFLGGFDDVVTVKEHTILGINSARGWQARKNWAEGSVNIDRLRDQLETHRPTILMAHHPFTQPPGARLKVETRRGKRGLSLAANLGVKLILNGHVHEPSFSIPLENEVSPISISCGTLSSRLRQSPPSLNMIEFSEAGLHVRTIEASSTATERTLIEHQFQTDGTFSQ